MTRQLYASVMGHSCGKASQRGIGSDQLVTSWVQTPHGRLELVLQRDGQVKLLFYPLRDLAPQGDGELLLHGNMNLHTFVAQGSAQEAAELAIEPETLRPCAACGEHACRGECTDCRAERTSALVRSYSDDCGLPCMGCGRYECLGHCMA